MGNYKALQKCMKNSLKGAVLEKAVHPRDNLIYVPSKVYFHFLFGCYSVVDTIVANAVFPKHYQSSSLSVITFMQAVCLTFSNLLLSPAEA